MQVEQRPSVEEAPVCVLFSAPAGDLLEWCEVDRAEVGKSGGVQRRKSPAKTNAISKYLEQDPRNTIPAALTIALYGVRVIDESGSTHIKVEGKSKSLVIDGQHRLYGAAAKHGDMPLNIVGLIDPSDLEVAFQFLVINNKSTRVPSDHIRLLALQYDDEELRARLATARINLDSSAPYVGIVDGDEASPFYRSLMWPVDDNRKGQVNLVRPAAIELALNYCGRKELPGLENDDALIGFFFAMWGAIKEAWSDLWVADSRLLSKAGLVAMTMFMVDDLTPLIDRGEVDAGDPDSVYGETRKVLESLTPEFWAAEWDLKGLDTQAGRQVIVEALQKTRRNLRRDLPWETEVRLVSDRQPAQ
ncbi:DGQHR domain-containing protein [Euzebya pacifica]|uniref:DGQHR domain-containing protein n=1 Tax=Euzebya pacifica TaxID=1608957 RepID=UPI0013DFDD5E|nr:DGQHR domain-containing protein [Euzebya pacifica]